jgi:acyl-coenzyme A thioesterase PaaI-like protein
VGSKVKGGGPWRPIATLDLRIDYMKPATPGRDLLARAECYKVTRNVAFVRGVAYHDDPSDPIATTVATFMLSTPDGPDRGSR